MPSPTISETQYYLRWWLVDQLLALCGRGVFRATPALLRVYYRLLGARIGRGAIIDRRAKVPPPPLLPLPRCCPQSVTFLFVVVLMGCEGGHSF